MLSNNWSLIAKCKQTADISSENVNKQLQFGFSVTSFGIFGQKCDFRIVCYSPSVDRTSAIIILKRAVVGVQCSVASTHLFAHSHSSVLRLFEGRIDTSRTHGHLLFTNAFLTLPNIAQSPGLFFARRWRCCSSFLQEWCLGIKISSKIMQLLFQIFHWSR